MSDITDEELEQFWEIENEILEEIANNIGVSRSHWCAEMPEDYNFNLQYTNKMVTFQNRQVGEKYRLKAPTYADIWKAFEKSLVDIGPTDHIFIETITIEDTILKIHTGS